MKKTVIRIYHDPNNREYTYELIRGDVPDGSPLHRTLFVKRDWRNKDVVGSGRNGLGYSHSYTPSTQFIPLPYSKILLQQQLRRVHGN